MIVADFVMLRTILMKHLFQFLVGLHDLQEVNSHKAVVFNLKKSIVIKFLPIKIRKVVTQLSKTFLVY